MKKILLTLAATLITFSMFGQGGIVMNTRATGVSAPATNILTGLPVSGTGFLAQLYYGAPGVAESAMLAALNAPGGTVPAPATYATGTSAGFITTGSGGGNRYVDTAVVAAGATAWFQIRGWEASLGNTWEVAYPAWLSGSNPTAVLGKSAVVPVATSATATQSPTFLTPLTAYTLAPVPEPSVIALGALGLAALLYRRRK
jgi:hypothetical protein